MNTSGSQREGNAASDVEQFLADLDAMGVVGPYRTPHVMARFGDSAVSQLIAAMQESNGIIRHRAALMLSDMKSERAVEPLIMALRDEDPRMRAIAAVALGKFADPRALEPLSMALKSEVDYVVCHAVSALSKLPDHRVKDMLAEVLTTHRAPSARVAAALALVDGGESGRLVVNLAPSHPNVATRVAALRAIGRSEDPGAFTRWCRRSATWIQTYGKPRYGPLLSLISSELSINVRRR